MSNFNARAVVLRTNTNHGIRCSSAAEQQLVFGLNNLLEGGQLSEMSVERLVSDLPTSFFADNQFDSPKQYARLLWGALDTADLILHSKSNVTNITNFNAPVQTQILQTGSNSKAKISQTNQQNQLYSKEIMPKLKAVADAVRVEITDENDQAKALAIVDQAKIEAENGQPKSGKMKKFLSAMGKWSGERVTKAVDAAIECAVKYGATGGS
jgi:hypothetical protein